MAKQDNRLNMRQNFEAGKGSRRRPCDEDKFRAGWDRAFGPESKEKEEHGKKSTEESN